MDEPVIVTRVDLWGEAVVHTKTLTRYKVWLSYPDKDIIRLHKLRRDIIFYTDRKYHAGASSQNVNAVFVSAKDELGAFAAVSNALDRMRKGQSHKAIQKWIDHGAEPQRK